MTSSREMADMRISATRNAIDTEYDRLVELKRMTMEAELGRVYYPSLCGYHIAIGSMLAKQTPDQALDWIRRTADRLEQELPFIILKNSS